MLQNRQEFLSETHGETERERSSKLFKLNL